MTQPGWYPDASGQQRYWDGQQWTQHQMPAQQPASVIEGPNHVLHGILTLITWPLCGGWAWVWLVVAMQNKKRVRYIR